MFLRVLVLFCALLSTVVAQQAKFPKLNDPALRLEALVTAPEIEAPTTVCSAPDGSFYVGCDPRDTRLNTERPECYIVRYSSMGSDKKRTVFVDKIYSPAGSQWLDGWLYVTHDPFLSRFKDTDGDGLADVREDLVTNLGHVPYGGLNDHCVSGFTLGMDGYFYISVGDRGVYQAKGKDGSTLTMQGGGIIRCRPDGTELNIFSTGTRNHLAVLLDEEDNAFTRDNTDDGNGWWTRLTHHIEGGYYGYPYDYQQAPNYGVTKPSPQTLEAMKKNGHTDLIQPGVTPTKFLPAMADFGGGSPTGGVCYLSDGLPEQYRGKLIFSEWGKAALFVTEVARDGATFKLVKDTPLIESAKGADFRPMQVNVAPDGSLLIADWGWGGWKAPKREGTVWRLSWPDAKLAPRLQDESKASVEELITALGHPDRDQRLRAQEAISLLLEKNQRSPLFGKVAVISLNPKLPNEARFHAMWSFSGFKRRVTSLSYGAEILGPSRQMFDGATKDPDAQIRSQYMRADPFNISGTFDEQHKEPSILEDKDPCVRLHAVIAYSIAAQGWAAENELPRLFNRLDDSDPTVKFAAIDCLRRLNRLRGPNGAFWGVFAEILPRQKDYIARGILSSFSAVENDAGVDVLRSVIDSTSGANRKYAIAALGYVALRPKAWDGHWWGTQPVKSGRPLNSEPWEGTTKAIGALSSAVADKDEAIRIEAARAFSRFNMIDLGGREKNVRAAEALAALRQQLSVETSPAVRKQLIESLGVQRDPEALMAFASIALDPKADADFRDTAIGAIANTGGDAAKKTIAELAGADLSVAALRKVIESAGAMKVSSAAPKLVAHLDHTDTGIRFAAVKALNSLGLKSWSLETVPALIATVDDKDNKVGAAAIEALGNARVVEALPLFVSLAERNKYRRETVTAIAAMGNESTVPLLVTMLGDGNPSVRRDAAKALRRFRAAALPLIEQKLASGEIRAEFGAEIRSYFESGIIDKWKMIGPFENVWDAVHPPEKDALAAGGKAEISRKYTDAEGKESSWRDINANSEEGRVDLGKAFKTNAMVCAYAWAEIDAPESASAKIFCGSDDQIAIWINGQQVHNASASREFQPDKDEVPVQLAAGKNQLLVKIGNLGSSWEFAVRMPGYADGKFIKSKELSPEEKQRAFVLATKPDGNWLHPGDATRGEQIFFDPAAGVGAICATCHAVKGKGGQIGPDLTAVAVNYKRPDLLTSILEPSKTIALGFEQAIVETTGGETFVGAQRQETNDTLTLIGADGQPHVVKKAEIKSRKALEQSLMPPGLTLALKPEDVADLLAFLERQRGQ
jgi:putative membrane-bound dehydrogenase-like protein